MILIKKSGRFRPWEFVPSDQIIEEEEEEEAEAAAAAAARD